MSLRKLIERVSGYFRAFTTSHHQALSYLHCREAVFDYLFFCGSVSSIVSGSGCLEGSGGGEFLVSLMEE